MFLPESGYKWSTCILKVCTEYGKDSFKCFKKKQINYINFRIVNLLASSIKTGLFGSHRSTYHKIVS